MPSDKQKSEGEGKSMNGLFSAAMPRNADATGIHLEKPVCPLFTGPKTDLCDCPKTRLMVLQSNASCHHNGDCLARKLFPEKAKEEYSKRF